MLALIAASNLEEILRIAGLALKKKKKIANLYQSL